MLFHTRILSHELGLRFRKGELYQVLQPGKHFKPPNTEDEVYDRLKVEFEHKLLEVLLQNADLRAELEVVDLSDTQRALVFKNGRLQYLLGPGRRAFWKQTDAFEVEIFDIESFRFDHKQAHQIIGNAAASKYLQAIQTRPDEKIIIYKDGQLVELFGPGTFVYWNGSGNVTFESIDLREQVLDVSGQEIMTADKVTLRVNLVISYQITDPLKSVSVVDNSSTAIYREAQLALRAAVGTRPLDKLLSDKDQVTAEVRDEIKARAEAFGVKVCSAGIRDVILPGNMKTILNQVIEAEKQAEANLIRRREETAAARSQANTARLMAENPVLRRMKELEQLQSILAGSKTTFVLGQGEISQQIRQMVVTDDS